MSQSNNPFFKYSQLPYAMKPTMHYKDQRALPKVNNDLEIKLMNNISKSQKHNDFKDDLTDRVIERNLNWGNNKVNEKALKKFRMAYNYF